MKKISVYFFALIVALGFFTSCTTDVETPAPTITVSADAANPATAKAGDVLKFTVQAEAAEKIEKINVTQKIGTSTSQVSGFPVTTGFTESGTKYLNLVSYTVPAGTTSNIDLTFEVTDKNGKIQAETKTITVGAATVRTQNAKLLAGQENNTTGSFYATAGNGTVYKQADAKTNAASIDFLYFYGATNRATIASPRDTDAGTIYNNATTGLQTWSTKNDTKFKTTTLTAAEFNNATFASINTAAEGAALTKVNDLSAGKVFAFVTAAGKKGLILVNTVTGSQSGTIDLSVKIQD